MHVVYANAFIDAVCEENVSCTGDVKSFIAVYSNTSYSYPEEKRKIRQEDQNALLYMQALCCECFLHLKFSVASNLLQHMCVAQLKFLMGLIISL